MSKKKPAEIQKRPDDSVLLIPGDTEQSVYRFITVAARRARQLQSGMRPKVPVLSRKMTRVAIEETRRGLVEYNETAKPEPPVEEPAEE